MTSDWKVTWIVPVLNGMPYIREMLASIEAQTFKDYEVIVWDNGSADGTVEELRRWIPSRLKGRVVADQPLRLGLCRRALVDAVQTPLIAMMDADDVNHPQRLEKQLAFLRRHPELIAFGAQLRYLSHDGVPGGQHYKLPCSHEAICVRLLRLWSMWQNTILCRKEALLAAGGYGDEQPVEDYSLWMRLPLVGRIANMPEMLVDYRVRETSISHTAIRERSMEKHIDECVIRHGWRLYGLKEPVIRRLRGGGRMTCKELRTVWTSLLRNHARPGALAAALLRLEVWPFLKHAVRRKARPAHRDGDRGGVSRTRDARNFCLW